MSLVNSDENKTFGVVLRTPVENSKGIPHILEHSVLCGSRKYPIKEPFVEVHLCFAFLYGLFCISTACSSLDTRYMRIVICASFNVALMNVDLDLHPRHCIPG